jgi:hypothetical protein
VDYISDSGILYFVIAFFIIRHLWKVYINPAAVLGRQAANMNWIVSGRVEDSDGYNNVRYVRDNMEAVVSFQNGNVVLTKPNHLEPFKDFIEIERYLATNVHSTWVERLCNWADENEISSHKIPRDKDDLYNLTQLNLNNNQLTDLPKEIGNLTKLTHLNLNNNQLTDLPKEIGNLTNLMYLKIENNQLTELPEEICNLMHLTWLYLDPDLVLSAKQKQWYKLTGLVGGI